MNLEIIHSQLQQIYSEVKSSKVEQRYLTKKEAMKYLGYNSINSLNTYLQVTKIPVINNKIDKYLIDKFQSGKR